MHMCWLPAAAEVPAGRFEGAEHVPDGERRAGVKQTAGSSAAVVNGPNVVFRLRAVGVSPMQPIEVCHPSAGQGCSRTRSTSRWMRLVVATP